MFTGLTDFLNKYLHIVGQMYGKLTFLTVQTTNFGQTKKLGAM